jgi:DNA-binding response OmpR family regulator
MQILVVEDEPKVATLLMRGLSEENYSVDVAQDGQVALDKFAINSYDLVILDCMLPAVDGITVCREMRKQDTSVPIIMLTAKGELEDRIAGLDSGADDYLTKPFAFGELLARIRALLRRGSAAMPTVLTLDNLQLDPARREVIRGETTLLLTAREYSLLEYFLRNQGLSLSKTQILGHVWDYNYDGLSNIVETYVKYLRKKLQVAADSAPLIHTIRGYGYVMKVNTKP